MTARGLNSLETIVEHNSADCGYLSAAGIKPVRRKSFQTATKQMIQRSVGYASLFHVG